MSNTRLFANSSNTDLGLSAATAPLNTNLFAAEAAPVNTNLFATEAVTAATPVVNTTLFANAVEETSSSNDVVVQFGHLNDLLLLEGYTNLADLVVGLSELYSAGL